MKHPEYGYQMFGDGMSTVAFEKWMRGINPGVIGIRHCPDADRFVVFLSSFEPIGIPNEVMLSARKIVSWLDVTLRLIP